MIRVKISNVEKQFATIDFPSQAEADQYIIDRKADEHWGKSDKDIVEIGADGKLVVVGHQDAEIFFSTEDVTAHVELENRIKLLVVSGESDAEVCNKCLALVGGYNKEKALSTEQIQAMASAFANVDYCLSKKMPKSAKVLISAITPDEVVVTTELKSLLLEVLKAY